MTDRIDHAAIDNRTTINVVEGSEATGTGALGAERVDNGIVIAPFSTLSANISPEE